MKPVRGPSPSVGELEGALKALADRTRLRILALLGNNEVCVCHIHDSLGLPQPTVSRHLAYLRRAGLVAVRRDGSGVAIAVTDQGVGVPVAEQGAIQSS